MRRALPVVAIALALTACDDFPQARSKSEIENIARKEAADFTAPLLNRDSVHDYQIAELKRRIEFLEKGQRPAATPQEPRMTHQLVGTSFGNEGKFRYSSLEQCETARRRLIDDWAADDRAKRERGVIYTSRPTPSCLPL